MRPSDALLSLITTWLTLPALADSTSTAGTLAYGADVWAFTPANVEPRD